METGGTPKILDYQEKTWPTLVELIKLADKYDFKLTLEFNPQWAFYILADESRLKLLRNWEQNNHEIALHHHGPSHEDWNGYSNIEAKKKDPRYIGTISEMMSIMEQLSVSGKILSGGITNENTDWPKGIIYDTDGGELKTDLLSKPKNITFNNFPVLQLRYRQYATISSKSASLVEIKESYSNNEDAIMGIVFHAHDYNRTSQNQSDIKKLFASLSENNIEIKTVKDILSE